MTAKNLKFLRKYYGDTQKKLGKMLNVGQSTMSEYESGKTQIPDYNLRKIAKRYNVSIDDLISKDLSLEFSPSQSILTEDVMTLGNKLIRLITSTKAKKNDNFNRGMENYYDAITIETVASIDTKISKLDLAIKQFQKAWEEDETYVALANSISIVFLIYSCYTSNPTAMERILTHNKIISMVELHKILLHDPSKPNETNPYEKQRKATYKKYEDLVYENIKLLKSKSSSAALGDYYAALCFLLGFMDESIEYGTSLMVGTYMMLQLGQLDNKYAIDLLKQLSLIS